MLHRNRSFYSRARLCYIRIRRALSIHWRAPHHCVHQHRAHTRCTNSPICYNIEKAWKGESPRGKTWKPGHKICDRSFISTKNAIVMQDTDRVCHTRSPVGVLPRWVHRTRIWDHVFLWVYLQDIENPYSHYLQMRRAIHFEGWFQKSSKLGRAKKLIKCVELLECSCWR